MSYLQGSVSSQQSVSEALAGMCCTGTLGTSLRAEQEFLWIGKQKIYLSWKYFLCVKCFLGSLSSHTFGPMHGGAWLARRLYIISK